MCGVAYVELGGAYSTDEAVIQSSFQALDVFKRPVNYLEQRVDIYTYMYCIFKYVAYNMVKPQKGEVFSLYT